jgi:SAM-dependent methyltransferase
MAAVLSLGEPPAVNEAYDAWEIGSLLDAVPDGLEGPGLDLGAGVGRATLRFAPRVSRLVCGDLAEGMLQRLRSRVQEARVENTDPVRLRSDRLPFRDRTFSLVLCLGLLEHLPRAAQEATLFEVARVLRPGGVLALVLNNASSRFLGDPRDNPYRDGEQRESGYFCAVVSERALLEKCAPRFTDRPVGSNLFYSLQRHAARRLPETARRSPALRPFFDRAASWDRALRPLGALARAAADHHLHLLMRR